MPRLRHSFCIDRPSEMALHGRSSRMGMILCVGFSRCSVSLKVPDLENQFLFALSFFSITIKQVILETVQQREEILRRSPILKFPKMVNGAASPHQFCAVVSVSPRITRTVPHMESLFILCTRTLAIWGVPQEGWICVESRQPSAWCSLCQSLELAWWMDWGVTWGQGSL